MNLIPLEGELASPVTALRENAARALFRHHLEQSDWDGIARLLGHADETVRNAAALEFWSRAPKVPEGQIQKILGIFVRGVERGDSSAYAAARDVLLEQGVDLSPVASAIIENLSSTASGVADKAQDLLTDLLLRARKRSGRKVVLDLERQIPFLVEEFLRSGTDGVRFALLHHVAQDPRKARQVVDELGARTQVIPTRPIETLVRQLRRMKMQVQISWAKRPPKKPFELADFSKVIQQGHKPFPWPALLRLADGAGPILVTEGQYAPEPGRCRRIGLFNRNRCLADAWITTSEIPSLVEALRKDHLVRRGEWDVMFATGWSYVWTTDGHPFELWDREGLVVWEERRAGLTVRSGGRVATDQADHVHAYLEGGWVFRGVRIMLKDGTGVDVACEEDHISEVDITYDGLNIMCEAAWTVSVARAIASVLGVAVKADEPL